MEEGSTGGGGATTAGSTANVTRFGVDDMERPVDATHDISYQQMVRCVIHVGDTTNNTQDGHGEHEEEPPRTIDRWYRL